MSNSTRQSELFAGQDWTTLYQAFTQVNFNASDPDTINTALRQYIAANYPEDYNDWIESSEFVMLIDLLAWLAGTLAFKLDINARENFLESATARESILRLARFLSYTPRRNQPATGLVKLVSVQTDDEITDSNGASLANSKITWNDPNNTDWFEDMTTILNSAFVATNPYGTPITRQTVSGIRNEIYRVNCLMREQTPGFTATVSGTGMPFELCNATVDDNGAFTERDPDPTSAFQMIYRNDSNGNASARTGFFLLFKQGTTATQVFNISNPIANQVLDASATGINENDVWVQSIDGTGAITTKWTRVPALYNENITFNSVAPSNRDIYQVITRDADAISVRFSDGLFGNAPSGRIKLVYRTSNGLRYQIRPSEIVNAVSTISYYNRRGARKTLTLTFSLQETVSNAAPRETDAQIKERATAVYATQSRMVSGEDYNMFPLSSNIAVKLKALNRVYSGHSRFIDMEDPTSNYSNANVFSDDGMLYYEAANLYKELPTSLNETASYLVNQEIQPLLRDPKVAEYVLFQMLKTATPSTSPWSIVFNGVWRQATGKGNSTTGYFTFGGTSSATRVTLARLLQDGALIEFTANGVSQWIAIDDVAADPLTAPVAATIAGNVTLAGVIPDGATITGFVPRFDPELSAAMIATLIGLVGDTTSFTLCYDPSAALPWTAVMPSETLLASDSGYPMKIATIEYVSNLWRMTAHGLSYVFESERNVRFYFDGETVLDGVTGDKMIDTVRVLDINKDLATGLGLDADVDFAVSKMFYYPDGTPDPRRVRVTFTDVDADGWPDLPTSFNDLLSANAWDRTLFWIEDESMGVGSFSPLYTVLGFDTQALLLAATPAAGAIGYAADTATFWIKSSSGWSQQTSGYRNEIGRGRNVAASWKTASATPTPYPLPIKFQWKHYAAADFRIDPAITNVIDVFVLSTEYDTQIRQWVADGAVLADMPAAPTELDLRLSFANYEQFKMFSDQIVWRPVNYKFLFGTGADEDNLRAQFKVVKLASSSLSDGEVQTKVINAINAFFDVTLWDFGETFYFSQLAAYVHQQLAGDISSIVIVPSGDNATFGDGFEVDCRSDEMFLSTAQVSDVLIIASNTKAALRMN